MTDTRTNDVQMLDVPGSNDKNDKVKEPNISAVKIIKIMLPFPSMIGEPMVEETLAQREARLKLLIPTLKNSAAASRVDIKDAVAGAKAPALPPLEPTAAKLARQNRDITALLAIPHTPGTSYGRKPGTLLNPSKKRTASGTIKETSKLSTIVTTGATPTVTSSLVRSATAPSTIANIGPFLLHRAETFPTTTATPSPARATDGVYSVRQGPAVSPINAAMSRQLPPARLPQQPSRVQPTSIAPGRRPSVANLDFSKKPKADPFRTRKSLGKASAGRDQFPQTAPVPRRMGGATSPSAQPEDPRSPENSSNPTPLFHPLPAKPSTDTAQGAEMDLTPTMPQRMRPDMPMLATNITTPVATPWVPLSARPSSAVSSTPSVAPVAPMTPADSMPLDVKFTIPADHHIDVARDPRRVRGVDKTRDPRRKVQEPIDVIVLDD